MYVLFQEALCALQAGPSFSDFCYVHCPDDFFSVSEQLSHFCSANQPSPSPALSQPRTVVSSKAQINHLFGRTKASSAQLSVTQPIPNPVQPNSDPLSSTPSSPAKRNPAQQFSFQRSLNMKELTWIPMSKVPHNPHQCRVRRPCMTLVRRSAGKVLTLHGFKRGWPS